MQGFQFKTVTDICNYVEMTRTDQAEEYAKEVKNVVKAYGDNTIKYMVYDDKQKIWQDLKERKNIKVSHINFSTNRLKQSNN